MSGSPLITTMHLPLLLLFISSFSAPLQSALGKTVVRTIDDTVGDVATGQRPIYQPARGVWEHATCANCTLDFALDPAQAKMGTWTGAAVDANSGNASIELTFTGTRLVLYYILVGNQFTETFFELDGKPAFGEFLNNPGPASNNEIIYNQTAFTWEKLPLAEHTLVILLQAHRSGLQNLLIFDYAEYTTEEPDAPASVSLAALVGSLIAAIVGALFAGFLGGTYYHRRISSASRKSPRKSSLNLESDSNSHYSEGATQTGSFSMTPVKPPAVPTPVKTKAAATASASGSTTAFTDILLGSGGDPVPDDKSKLALATAQVSNSRSDSPPPADVRALRAEMEDMKALISATLEAQTHADRAAGEVPPTYDAIAGKRSAKRN